MKKVIIALLLLFVISTSAEAGYGRWEHFKDHMSYKHHMHKRHKTFKKQHRKNVKYQHKIHSGKQ